MTYRSRWWYGTPTAIAVTAIALLVMSCGDGTVEPPPPPPAPVATTVTVTPATATLTAFEETVRFTAEVRDQNGQVMTGATVAWTSSDPSVAAVDASGQATAVANGSATITATAGSASGTAAVTVRLNRSPEVAASVPDMPLRRPVLLDASTYFSDPDGDTLTYRVETSEAIVAFGYVSDDSVLGIVPVGQGSATLTVTATDPAGASVEQSFLVTVGNQAPYSVADLTSLNMVVGSTINLDLSGYFRDPEGQQLSYGARDLFQPGVSVSLTGSVLTLEAVTDERDPKMEPRVAVTATDGDESTAQYFDVYVAALAPPAGARYERQGSTIVLHWEPSAEATHYNIYHHDVLDRCGVRPDGSTFLCNELATGVQDTTYTHTDPDQNANHYWIVACGAAGCSYPGWAGLPLDASVAVVGRDRSSLTLSLKSRWAERVELYRSTAPGGPYSLVDGAVATNGQNDLRHVDDGLSADATYYYRIKACTDAGCTDQSPPAGGRTEASGAVAIPPLATGIRGSRVEVPLGTDEAEIGWDEVPGATYYRVYQEGEREAEVAAPGTSYYDSHPNSRVFEFVPTRYQVLACNKAGCSTSAAAIVVR
ncbi:MAG: Ig-like domain-containing protein [Gemmatimonadetes bacterium]|nr:Ig-like domain-containing protein [Gemmatimonadota bacterium]